MTLATEECTMTYPSILESVAEVFARYPASVRARLLEIRKLIFAVAAETDGVGLLTETLKWGEPAYLTEASKSGTTIRLGVPRSAPDRCALFFNCKTTLVETFRSHFSNDFTFEGNQALVLPAIGPLPKDLLTLCLRAALTYHRGRANSRLGH